MKKKPILLGVLALLLCAMGYLQYRMMTFGEHNPVALQQFAATVQAQTAQAIRVSQIQADVLELSKTIATPIPKRDIACRQLPVRINRSALALWGKNEQGQTVQLERPTAEVLPVERQVTLWDLVNRLIGSRGTLEEPRNNIAESLRTTLERARKRILSLQDIPCAYEWNIVRGIVEMYGPHLILRDHGQVNPLAKYDPRVKTVSNYQNARRISDAQAEQENDVALSVRMVENATALVFARSVAEQSGHMPDTLDSFRDICVPFNIAYTGFEEAAILLNRGRYLEAIQGPEHQDIKMIQDVDRGVPNEFISRIAQHVQEVEPAYVKTKQALPLYVECRFPPQAAGPDQGMEFFPDELNDPIINFVNAELSEQTTRLFASR
jgi:hypothetical protein